GTLPPLAVFVTTTSACEAMALGSEAESFEVLSSLPPATVAVLISGVVADWLMATVIVITGYEAPPSRAFDRVQVTTWPAIAHPQPVPDAVDGVRPAGSVSETVTRPLDATGPMLLTVRLKLPVEARRT